jgi:hypothetical protein
MVPNAVRLYTTMGIERCTSTRGHEARKGGGKALQLWVEEESGGGGVGITGVAVSVVVFIAVPD